MSVIAVIFRKIWSAILWLLSLFKRLICWRRRGRKNSGTILPMTTDHIADLSDIQQSVPSNEYELESWDSWGGEDQTGKGKSNKGYPGYRDGHIAYRQGNRKSETEPEDETNYFEDMIPHFKKPAKILIKKKEDMMAGKLSSRLAMTSDIPIPPQDGELGAWEDQEKNVWGEEVMEDLSWEADAAIKEKRRLERERRQAEHQKKKMERDAMKSYRKDSTGLPAVRLS